MAEPAETARLRGPKQRTKADKRDARQLQELLEIGWLPGAVFCRRGSDAQRRHARNSAGSCSFLEGHLATVEGVAEVGR